MDYGAGASPLWMQVWTNEYPWKYIIKKSYLHVGKENA